jgi:hypothetical protein
VGLLKSLLRIFKRDAGNLNTTRRWTVRAATTTVRYYLGSQGWGELRDSTLDELSVFPMEKGQTRIAIFVSGVDRPLLQTHVSDILRHTITKKLTPVFICAEQIDPRILEYLNGIRSVVCHVSKIRDLDTSLEGVLPSVRGAIDHVKSPSVIGGWAQLLGCGRKALIRVRLNDDLLGECLASNFRQDLLHLGDGNFGFQLTLETDQDVKVILSELIVEIYDRGRFISRLPISSSGM